MKTTVAKRPSSSRAVAAAGSQEAGLSGAPQQRIDGSPRQLRLSGQQPVQRVQLNGEQKPGAYLPQPEEPKEAFRERMRREMEQMRAEISHNDATEPFTGTVAPDQPELPRPRPTPGRRERLLEQLKQHTLPKPTIGISNRTGYGFSYDKAIFDKAPGVSKTKKPLLPSSLPPGFEPVAEKPTEEELAQDRADVQRARDPEQVARHLNGVSGVYIPGGQDREEDGSLEKVNREAYEQAVIAEARLRGMPILAVCGGSRSLARGFGGDEATLSEEDQAIHNPRGGVSARAHKINLTTPHSILGSATPRSGNRPENQAPEVSAVNSTHTKVVAHDAGKLLRKSGVERRQMEQELIRLGGDFQGSSDVAGMSPDEDYIPELMIAATDEHGNPEGFETIHGAPMLGVTSHPEALYGSRSTRKEAQPDARTWADNIFNGFAQSAQAYAGRQRVNAEFKEQVRAKRAAQEREARAHELDLVRLGSDFQ